MRAARRSNTIRQTANSSDRKRVMCEATACSAGPCTSEEEPPDPPESPHSAESTNSICANERRGNASNANSSASAPYSTKYALS